MRKPSYGVPYLGSKNRIADEIVSHLPEGRPFEKFCQENDITDLRQLEGMKGINPHYRIPFHSLKRLQQLDGLDLSKVEFRQMNYADYEHQEGDVVYCDPPYKNTDHRYGIKFDTYAFWEWVRTRDYPVFVSEYEAPSDFEDVWSILLHTITSPDDFKIGEKNNSMRTEHLFIYNNFLKKVNMD